jgi:hypothetical protein
MPPLASPPLVDALLGMAGGNLKVYDVAGPKSYATNGVKLSANLFGLLSLKLVLPMDLSSDALNFVRVTSPSGPGSPTVTVRWYVTSTGLEVANATDLSAKSIRMMAIGN